MKISSEQLKILRNLAEHNIIAHCDIISAATKNPRWYLSNGTYIRNSTIKKLIKLNFIYKYEKFIDLGFSNGTQKYFSYPYAIISKDGLDYLKGELL